MLPSLDSYPDQCNSYGTMGFAVTANEEKAQRKFRRKLKPYLQELDPKSLTLPPIPKRQEDVTLGDVLEIGPSDITHVFNNEAMLAISHAIEDLASDTGEGDLFSTFQKMENFEYQKKRYLALANDLDAVRVWAEGQPPKRCGKIDFVPILHKDLKRYWIVLFNSKNVHAALICKQVNRKMNFQDKAFVGFYTFNPFLVESIRRELNLVSCGLSSIIHQWEKELDLHSLSLNEIGQKFLPPLEEAKSSQ